MKIIIPSCLLGKTGGEKKYYLYKFVEVGKRMADKVTVSHT